MLSDQGRSQFLIQLLGQVKMMFLKQPHDLVVHFRRVLSMGIEFVSQVKNPPRELAQMILAQQHFGLQFTNQLQNGVE